MASRFLVLYNNHKNVSLLRTTPHHVIPIRRTPPPPPRANQIPNISWKDLQKYGFYLLMYTLYTCYDNDL